MKTIYIDSDHRCHTVDDGTRKAVETDCFDDKCDAFVEGHCYEVSENGVAKYPWKPYDQLEAAQAQYEAMLTDMDQAYAEGVANA